MLVVAQLNIQDKVLKVVGLQLNAQDGSTVCTHADRVFATLTQRSGIMFASACPEIDYRAQSVLMQLMSKVLPHRGALSPMHSHFCPMVPGLEKCEVNEHMNGNSVNYCYSLFLFYFLSDSIKSSLASKVGFSQSRLDAFFTQSAPK